MNNPDQYEHSQKTATPVGMPFSMNDSIQMLETMKDATQQLDTILQQLCTAKQSATLGKEISASGTAGHKNLKFPVCTTFDTYFQAITDALTTTSDNVGKIHIPVDNMCHQINAETSDVDSFASITRHTSFIFPTRSITSSSSLPLLYPDQDIASNGASTSTLPETNVLYHQFRYRLRQELRACDHLLPSHHIDHLTALAAQHVATQWQMLLQIITDAIFPSHFDVTTLTDDNNANGNAMDGVEWQQGPRVCRISIEECECNYQWGIRLQLEIKSLIQPHARNTSSQPATTASYYRIITRQHTPLAGATHQRGPRIEASSRFTVFLSKAHYEMETRDGISTSCSITLQLVDQKRPTDSKIANAVFQRISTALDTEDEMSSPPLPEFLNVSVWGKHGTLGLNNISDGQHLDEQPRDLNFHRLAFETPLPRNRIVQAACSRLHTLLLNDMGMVFAYGHTIDGALGLGRQVYQTAYVATAQLVSYFFDHLISVRAIACGGDQTIGIHSAVVSIEGKVFTWGVGIALGNGSVQSSDTPQPVTFPSAILASINDKTHEDTETELPIEQIACGGGFCVALSRKGYAFSWGKWSNGRLGLGKIPILHQSSRKYGNRKQFQSYQLYPKQILHHDGKPLCFTKVACGDAHCVAITDQYEVVTWGQGSHGQLGYGSVLQDALFPLPVFERGVNSPVKWRDVAAGANWSMALDTTGRVWSWGACGGAALGQCVGNDTSVLMTETIFQRHQKMVSRMAGMAKHGNTLNSISPAMPQLQWMTPHLIPSFSTGEITITSVSAGVQHGAALSVNGDLYVWGEGNGLGKFPRLVNTVATRSDSNESRNDAIGPNIAEHVVCGGNQIVAFTSGSFLARSMQHLFQRCAHLSACIDQDNSEIIDYSAEYEALAVDIALIVSGKRLLAHRLLLARRSPVLRDLILEQLPLTASNSNDDKQVMMELLLPQLRIDVARVLLEFIYTDNLSVMLDPQSYLLRDVLRSAQLYHLPRLVDLCCARQLALMDEGGFSFADDAPSESVLIHTSTLNDDLEYAFGDTMWTDLTLVAEGQKIPVHRCMLIARSEYFRALLTLQMKRDDEKNRVIVVEESYLSMLRILNFIYQDGVVIPSLESSGMTKERDDEVRDDQLLEDLITADKFGLERMKRLCEHAIHVNLKNCLEILVVADLVHATYLKQMTLDFLRANLPDVTSQPEFRTFREDFPHLLEELFTKIQVTNWDEFLLRDWHNAVEKKLTDLRDQDQRIWDAKASKRTFPWVPLMLAVMFATIYLSMMRTQAFTHPYVPAINLFGVGGIFVAIYNGWL